MEQTMTGNRVLLKIGGKVIGTGVQNVEFQDSNGLQDVDGLGDAHSSEFVVGKRTHTISLSNYRVSGKSLLELGLVPTADTLMTIEGLNIEVIDKASQTTQELYIGCKADTHTRSYQKHVISGENATFRALRKMV